MLRPNPALVPSKPLFPLGCCVDRLNLVIKAAISTLVPGLKWSTTRPRSQSPCTATYSNTRVIEVKLLPYSSDTPADRWPAVLGAVNSIAVANGFDGIDLDHTDGDRRQVSLRDSDGGSILLGSGGRIALMIRTGSYLR